MKFDPTRHHRRSIRLKGYDYSQSGAYYLTLVAHNRECFFGEIASGEMRLSTIGEIARDYWNQIQGHFTDTEIDEFVVMPNHLHGIIVIARRIDGVGVEYIQPQQRSQPQPEPQRHAYQHVIPNSVGSIVRSYKAAVTRWSRNNGHANFQWQRDYYEHIIRDEQALETIRAYIINNPLNWASDEENRGWG